LHMMYTLDTIVEKLRNYKPELQRKYPISNLGVFGSYARGEATENSDIDIAVEISGPMGLNFIAMANEIEDLFGIKVDVVPKRSIKPGYLPYVEKDIVYV
jgi:predicted nucleotidyltransferase